MPGARCGMPDPSVVARLKIMVRTCRLNLPAIEASLNRVQQAFPRINAELSDRRDPLTDEVVANMIAGYRRVNDWLVDGVDMFRMGESDRLVELNRLVLCGEKDTNPEPAQADHLAHIRSHFYETAGGGIGGLMEWLASHRDDGIWKLAAGMFIRVLSQPQLFPEGNHRTGTLLAGYLLARNGQPPFVLTAQNARYFFEPATLIKYRRKQSLDGLLKLPKLTKRVARLLEGEADSEYLLRH